MAPPERNPFVLTAAGSNPKPHRWDVGAHIFIGGPHRTRLSLPLTFRLLAAIPDAQSRTVITPIAVICWKPPSELTSRPQAAALPPPSPTSTCEIARLRAGASQHDRRRSRRRGACGGRPGSGARSACRLCKVIQRVMTEERATADSSSSRYVGHAQGALSACFSFLCLFFGVVSLRVIGYLRAPSGGISFSSRSFGLLTDPGDCVR